MDFNKVWDIALAATGIGGLGAFVFWSLHKEWLKLGIFANLTKEQTYNLMKMFLIFSFTFGLVALFLYAFMGFQQKADPVTAANNKTSIQQTVNGSGDVTVIGVVEGELTIGAPKKKHLADEKQRTSEQEP